MNGCTRGAKVAAEGGEGEGGHAGELRCCDVPDLPEPREPKNDRNAVDGSSSGPRSVVPCPQNRKGQSELFSFFLSFLELTERSFFLDGAFHQRERER
jgi:hypothetical protein